MTRGYKNKHQTSYCKGDNTREGNTTECKENLGKESLATGDNTRDGRNTECYENKKQESFVTGDTIEQTARWPCSSAINVSRLEPLSSISREVIQACAK